MFKNRTAMLRKYEQRLRRLSANTSDGTSSKLDKNEIHSILNRMRSDVRNYDRKCLDSLDRLVAEHVRILRTEWASWIPGVLHSPTTAITSNTGAPGSDRPPSMQDEHMILQRLIQIIYLVMKSEE